MAHQTPFVSIIIPCKNEAVFIHDCVSSLLDNDYPKEFLEILIVDGMSTDGTSDIIEQCAKRSSIVSHIKNEKKTTPTSLNCGLTHARGDVIIRADCHAWYPSNYISSLVDALLQSGAHNVGGRLVTKPRRTTLLGKSIAAVLSHRFGVGNSPFRTISKEPREVDTVAFGCFKKEVFQKVGMYNEKLVRSQDIEFNKRIKAAGFKIMLFPSMYCVYFCPSTFFSFAKHSFINGIWSTLPLALTRVRFSLRHYIPCVFVLAFIVLITGSFFASPFRVLLALFVLLYATGTFMASASYAIKMRELMYIFTLPLIFATLHVMYGLGSLIGLIKAPFFTTHS